MDIYAKEVSKMQSVSKSSTASKKRNFDATQFNTYGLPLGEYISCVVEYKCTVQVPRRGHSSAVAVQYINVQYQAVLLAINIFFVYF